MFGMDKKSFAALPFALLVGAGAITAQVPNPTTIAPGATSANVIAEGPDGIYVYHVQAVDRQLDAVNYLNRRGSTKIDFQGTELLPQASGEAKVNAVTGKTAIDVKFKGLKQANSFGPGYFTYVLWAISAEGRPQNLGELELSGDNASLNNLSSSFQTFGMIVTAEPYYSVSQPSDVVVLKNVFADQTQGVLQQVNVHYQLLPKGLYAPTAGQNAITAPVTDREHTPLALYEAYNAERIATDAGALKYAADIMGKGETQLRNATDLQNNKNRDVKMIFTYARGATQSFEDARIVTLRKQAEERAAAQVAAKERAQAEAAASQVAAANSQAEAERAAAAKAQADAEREKADAARARAEADAANARAQADAANKRADQSANDANAVREKLKNQLNAVLQTSESARGLVVNLSDVLFDTGKYTLKQGTQLSLAKVATILQLYPGLKVQVEGYTDSVGSDDYNLKLSQNRANAVHDFLVTNGVPSANVTSTGYGKADPVADNGTAAGRAQNRRVNMVVSGDAIGVQQSNGPQ